MRLPTRHRAENAIIPTHLSLRDALDEAVAAMLARPARAALTVLGTVLGIAAFVAVLGLTATAGGQISQRFTALAATEVTVEDAPIDPSITDYPYTEDAEERLTRLNGVRNAGVYWHLSINDGDVLVYPRPPSFGADDGEPLPVVAASPGYLSAIHPVLSTGRLFDRFHDGSDIRVCVLGRAAAARLGITRVDDRPAVFIGTVPFTVIGVIDNVQRQADTLLSVVVPQSSAVATWGLPSARSGTSPKILIETNLGAAPLIADQAALALRPDQPERFKVIAPPDPKELKEQVGTDLSSLFLALAAICLVIGAVGIANTTLIAVLERTAEIGLRRSLGARRRHIAVQFLTESAALGLLGGLIGTSLGILTVVLTALAKDWTPVLEPLTVLPSPAIGALTGILAGLYPSWRAARIEPVEALRR